MKNLILSLLIVLPLSCFAQLSNGKYKIYCVKIFSEGQTVTETLFDSNSKSLIRVVDNKMLIIVIDGYPVFTFSIEKAIPIPKEKSKFLIPATELQGQHSTNLIYAKDTEHVGLDMGILAFNRSPDYSNIFFIVRDDEEKGNNRINP